MIFVDADKPDINDLIKLSKAFGHPTTDLGRFHFTLELLFNRSDHPLHQFLASDLWDRPLAARNIDALQDLAGVKSLP